MSHWDHSTDPAYNQVGSPADPAGYHRGIELASFPVRAVSFWVDRWWLIPLWMLWKDLPGEWPRVAVYVFYAVAGLWYAWNGFMAQRTGQSFGKRIMGTRAYRVRQNPSSGQMFYVAPGASVWVRDVMHAVGAVALGLGLLWPIWDSKRQTWADNWTRTFTVANAYNVRLSPDRFRYETIE